MLEIHVGEVRVRVSLAYGGNFGRWFSVGS